MHAHPWLLILACATSALASAPQEPAAQPAESSARVEATFVDREGKPVGGVRVLHRIWPGAESSSESAADGRTEVALAWDAQREGTWYKGYARKPGYALKQLTGDLRAGQTLDFGRLQLDPGGVIAGTVLDPSGAPLSGAMLLVVNADEHASPRGGQDAEGPGFESVADHGRTGWQGRFELIGVPPGRWYVAAKHESSYWHVSGPVELEPGVSAEVGPLQLDLLPSEYRIQGVVLGPDGEPVAGAEVSTSVDAPGGRSTLRSAAQTDEAGRFVLYLARLPRGAVELSVDPDDGILEGTSLNGVEPGARDVVVRLEATRELRLRVVDEQGRPVETYGWGLSFHQSDSYVMTGSPPKLHPGGLATLRVPDRPFELEIRSDAHNLKLVGELQPDSLPAVLEVVLRSSGAAISGCVTFQGQPVPGVFVELVQRQPSSLGGLVPGRWSGLYYGLHDATASTDASGCFRIPNDFPHLVYHVRAWAEGYAEGLSGPVQVGASGVRVELGVGGTVAGVVRLPGGLSPQGIELEFYREQVALDGIFTTAGKILRTATQADGTYRRPHLAPGTWLVKVTPTGTQISDLGWSRAQAEAESHPHVVQVEDQKTTPCDLALGADRLCVLEGRLAIGDKIREGYAQLLLEGPFALKLDFSGWDDQGRFQLTARRPGTYRLLLHAGPGHHQYKTITDLVELTPGTTAWERDLPVERWSGDDLRLDQH
jgi:hypothetical protein